MFSRRFGFVTNVTLLPNVKICSCPSPAVLRGWGLGVHFCSRQKRAPRYFSPALQPAAHGACLSLPRGFVPQGVEAHSSFGLGKRRPTGMHPGRCVSVPDWGAEADDAFELSI